MTFFIYYRHNSFSVYKLKKKNKKFKILIMKNKSNSKKQKIFIHKL